MKWQASVSQHCACMGMAVNWTLDVGTYLATARPIVPVCTDSNLSSITLPILSAASQVIAEQ
jgi:hypothetical protein